MRKSLSVAPSSISIGGGSGFGFPRAGVMRPSRTIRSQADSAAVMSALGFPSFRDEDLLTRRGPIQPSGQVLPQLSNADFHAHLR
jgi:hypothetical protein